MTKNQDVDSMEFKAHQINWEQLSKKHAAGVNGMEIDVTNTATSKVECDQVGHHFQRSGHYATVSYVGKQANEGKSRRKSVGFRPKAKDISSGEPIPTVESDRGTKVKGSWIQQVQKKIKKAFGKTSDSNDDHCDAAQKTEGFARRSIQPSCRVDEKKSSKSVVMEPSDFDDPEFQGKLWQTPKAERIQQKRHASDDLVLHKEERHKMLIELLSDINSKPKRFCWKDENEGNEAFSEAAKTVDESVKIPPKFGGNGMVP